MFAVDAARGASGLAAQEYGAREPSGGAADFPKRAVLGVYGVELAVVAVYLFQRGAPVVVEQAVELLEYGVVAERGVGGHDEGG